MNKRIVGTLALLLLASTPAAWSDTGRSYGADDTSRHASSADTRRRAEDGAVRPDAALAIGIGQRGTADKQPKYGYGSAKCIRQRRSSFSPWNHSKDCDHPAYSGGYYPTPYLSPYGYRQPMIIINNYNAPRYRR